MLDVIIAVIAGIFVGGLINALADELPFRTFFKHEVTPPDDATEEELEEYARFNTLLKQRNKRGYLPVYPDGTARPIETWLGLMAFALGKRLPDNPQADEVRSREHREPGFTLSWRHPLTEIMTAIFFGLAAYAAPNIDGMDMNTTQYFLNFVYMAIFSLVIVIDMEHKLILFVVMIPAIIIALLDAYFVNPPLPEFNDALIGAGVGFGLFFALYLFGFAFRWYLNNIRGRNITTVAFGYGDVVMFTFTGAVIGTLYTIVALILTIILGAVGAVVYLIVKAVIDRENTLMTAIPYGPYIVIATMIMLLWGAEVASYFF